MAPTLQNIPASSLRRLALPALLSIALVGCSGADSAKPPAGGMAVPVSIIEVQPTKVSTNIEAVGQTEGNREVEVRARVGGILVKRLYEEGTAVKAGQPMFQIDRAPFDIALAQARAQYAEQKAKQEQAKREAARLKGLLAQEAISQKEYDDAVSNAELSAASLMAAEANVHQAELNLSYTTVTAPVSGLSGRATLSEGTLVGIGAEGLLTTLVQINPIKVRFSLADSDMAQLQGAQKHVHGVELILPDGSTYGSKGKLDFAASQIDPKLGTLALRAEFDNPQAKVLPGQFVRVRVDTGELNGAFLVPQTAIMQSDQGRFVFVAGAGDKAEPRPVKVGEWQGPNWVVLGGLKAGDKVIVDNLIKVRPGAPVKPSPLGAAPAAAPGPKA